MPEFDFSFMQYMAALWIGGWLIASAFYRRTHGKPIFPCVPSTAVFRENWCSCRSLRSTLTRIGGGARNCMKVYVQGNELVVTPMFPFTLMFLPEIFGLDVRVPIASITAVHRAGLIGRSLRITFAKGGPPPMELKLRDESGLLRQLGKAVIDEGA